jgi:hypothetical protein
MWGSLLKSFEPMYLLLGPFVWCTYKSVCYNSSLPIRLYITAVGLAKTPATGACRMSVPAGIRSIPKSRLASATFLEINDGHGWKRYRSFPKTRRDLTRLEIIIAERTMLPW